MTCESLADFPWGPCGMEWWLPEPVPQAKVAEGGKGEAACPALLFPGIVCNNEVLLNAFLSCRFTLLGICSFPAAGVSGSCMGLYQCSLTLPGLLDHAVMCGLGMRARGSGSGVWQFQANEGVGWGPGIRTALDNVWAGVESPTWQIL